MKNKVWETAVRAPRSEKKDGSEVLQAPEWRPPAAHGETTVEQLCTLQAMGNPMLEQIVIFWSSAACGMDPVPEQEKAWGGSSGSQELLRAECNYHIPPVLLGQGEAEKLGMKELSWTWEKGVQGKVYQVCLCFHLSTSILIAS